MNIQRICSLHLFILYLRYEIKSEYICKDSWGYNAYRMELDK